MAAHINYMKLAITIILLNVYNTVATLSEEANGLHVVAWNLTAATERPLHRDMMRLFGGKNALQSSPPSNALLSNITAINASPSVVAATVSGTTGIARATASASDLTGTSSGGLTNYAAPIVKQHNLHRANHSAPDLVWDDALAAIAQTIAAKCVYAHNTSTGGGGYGQNIGAGAPPDQIDAMITNQMYNDEIGYYPGYGGEPDMGAFENWGHFSQIVWKSTTKLGCATQYCGGGLANTGSGISPYFTVCNYEPAGNFGKQYGANVLAPIGGAVVSIASGH